MARLYTHPYWSIDIIHSWQIPLSFRVKVKNSLRVFDLLTYWWCAFHCLSFIVNSLNLKWDQRRAHKGKKGSSIGSFCEKMRHSWLGKLNSQECSSRSHWFVCRLIWPTRTCNFKGLISMCAQRKQSTKTWKINYKKKIEFLQSRTNSSLNEVVSLNNLRL